MYLIDYIAYGLHLWYIISIFKKICRKPISQHPGLATSLECPRLGRPRGLPMCSQKSETSLNYLLWEPDLNFPGIETKRALPLSGRKPVPEAPLAFPHGWCSEDPLDFPCSSPEVPTTAIRRSPMGTASRLQGDKRQRQWQRQWQWQWQRQWQ